MGYSKRQRAYYWKHSKLQYRPHEAKYLETKEADKQAYLAETQQWLAENAEKVRQECEQLVRGAK